MFHGGSTFGFLNGANRLPVFPFYVADVSSYGKDIKITKICCTTRNVFKFLDYSAPLSESGGYTEKYQIAKEMIAADNKVLTLIPEVPEENPTIAYASVTIAEFLTYDQIISQIVRS